MIITYHGGGLIKAQLADKVVAFNPIGKDAEEKPVRFGANLVLISLNHPLYNGAEFMAHGSKTPLVIDGPGEYEADEVFVRGLPSSGPEGKINTIYSVLFEDIRLVHLGALVEPKLDDKIREAIGVVEILFVPVGAGRLAPAEAAKLALSFSPKIIIPIDYSGETKWLKDFLKEIGNNSEELEKLTLKKKDLLTDEVKTVVLKVSWRFI